MFETVTAKSHKYLDDQIEDLKSTCEKDPGVKEMVRYILAFSDEMAYATQGSVESRIGRDIIQIIWEISKIDLSNMGNSYHFSPSWASRLNSFISNYIYDDSAFDVVQNDFNGVFQFKPAGDEGWYQDPMIIVEAAIANRDYYDKVDSGEYDVFGRKGKRAKVDGTKVLALINSKVRNVL